MVALLAGGRTQRRKGAKAQIRKHMSEQFSYRDAGVDIDAANEAKDRIKQLARATFTPNVMTEIGSFGGMFRADFAQIKEPVLVSSAASEEDGTYSLDFNLAYHPSCVYDMKFSCPLTPAENRLSVPIRAGERLVPIET